MKEKNVYDTVMDFLNEEGLMGRLEEIYLSMKDTDKEYSLIQLVAGVDELPNSLKKFIELIKSNPELQIMLPAEMFFKHIIKWDKTKEGVGFWMYVHMKFLCKKVSNADYIIHRFKLFLAEEGIAEKYEKNIDLFKTKAIEGEVKDLNTLKYALYVMVGLELEKSIKENPEEVGFKTITLMSRAFSWEKSEEGIEFWAEMTNKWLEFNRRKNE